MLPQILSQVLKCAETNNWQQIMRESEEKYDIRPYKINNLSPNEILWLYNGIRQKESKKDLRLSSTYWQQNQRRIFVWFIVFYCWEFKKQPIDITLQDYEQFSHIFFHKAPSFLEFHCRNIIKCKKRPTWTQLEDQILMDTIKNHPVGKGNQIAKEIFFNTKKEVFRTPKQCRQRWYNHLDTSKQRSEWNATEDSIIVNYVNSYGKKWARIVKQLNHQRTEHMIKTGTIHSFENTENTKIKPKNKSLKQWFRSC